MQKGPWLADGHSTGEKIPRFNWTQRLPRSEDPATGPYPEPVESSPHSHTLFPFDPFQYYPPIYVQVSEVTWVCQSFRRMTSPPTQYCRHGLVHPHTVQHYEQHFSSFQ
jgi:hypothetical protein